MDAVGSIAVAAGTAALTQAAKYAVSYAADAVSGHVGVTVLNQIVHDAAAIGAKAGIIGRKIGKLVGKAAAGHSLPTVASKVKAMAATITAAGHQAIDLFAKSEEKEDKRNANLLTAAMNVGKVGLALGGGVALASGIVPLAGAGLAFAAADAIPRVFKAAFETPTSTKVVSLVDDIMVPIAKNLAYEGLGAFVGNVTRYNQIKNTFDYRVSQGEKAGELVGQYLPNCMKDAAKKIGGAVMKIDAGRFAMTEQSIQRANDVADACESLVKGGVSLADAAIQSTGKGEASTSYFDTAKKVAVISAGVAGGVAMAALAPSLAPVVAGTALLGVADKIVYYVKGKLYDAKEEVAEVAERQDQEAVKVEMIKPEVALDASTIIQNCPTAAAAA